MKRSLHILRTPKSRPVPLFQAQADDVLYADPKSGVFRREDGKTVDNESVLALLFQSDDTIVW